MAYNGIHWHPLAWSYLRLDDLAVFFNVCCISALFLPGLEVFLEASEVAKMEWLGQMDNIYIYIWSKLYLSIGNGMEWHVTWILWGMFGVIFCDSGCVFFAVRRCSLPCKTSSHVVIYGVSHLRLEEIASRVVVVADAYTTATQHSHGTKHHFDGIYKERPGFSLAVLVYSCIFYCSFYVDLLIFLRVLQAVRTCWPVV